MAHLELRPTGHPDYRIYYLHLSTHPDPTPNTVRNDLEAGERVTVRDLTPGCPSPVDLPLPEGKEVKAGCIIALSGNAGGVAPHLHFEVQRVLPMEQIRLEALRCDRDDDPSKACVPVDPYGWTGAETRCSSGTTQGDVYECLTGVPSQVLWRSAECHLLSSGDAVSQGFGVPWNVFSPSQLLLKSFCTSAKARVSVGSPRNTTYVYKGGYYWTGDAWKPFEYKGLGLVNNVWYPGAATADIPYVGDSTFFVAYTCEFIAAESKWKCGCSDKACTRSQWQMQEFRRQ